ncbi:MAG: ADP-glyceromanno-heptose 6-epimerase [Desulfobulbus oligotrophicus]|nr:ADP-glyceromanno-heptose 6-epimerase [Desulfobulbus oligotrophicus]
MIIVTGGLGFIGSNIIHALNARGVTDIILVDDFTDGTKFTNVSDAQVTDYLDKDEFLVRVKQGQGFNGKVDALLHQGACSATTEWNGKLVMENNFTYSKELFRYADQHRIPFIYASSASVYGNGTTFIEDPRFEKPINVYAYSKTLFDQYVRRHVVSGQSQVVGLRYFNVYGPREQHKGGMASVAFHLRNQLLSEGVIHLFEGSDGYGPGEQRRDFIHVEDVVDVILWFLEQPAISGIFNVGTGRSQSFNEVAQTVLAAFGYGELQYIPFPEHLKGRYQSFTEADITRLRSAGYERTFRSVESGVIAYMEWLG